MTQTELVSPTLDLINQNTINQIIKMDLSLLGKPYDLNHEDVMISDRTHSIQNIDILAVGAYLVKLKPFNDPKQLIGGIYLFNKINRYWHFSQKIMFGELSVYNAYFGEDLSFNPEGTVIRILPSEKTEFYQTQGYPILKHHVEYELYENEWRLCCYNCL